MIFTYKKYAEYLNFLKENGNVTSFNKIDRSRKTIILRHDIDLSVEDAYELAQIEKREQVSSTFFFLTNSHFYNLFSEINQSKLKWLVDNGFEIGLHFDPMFYGNVSMSQLEKYVTMECDLIYHITGKPVESISLHNPSIHNTFPLFKNYINAYDSEYFSEETYLSDSCMDFRNNNPYTFVEQNSSDLIQILLHPCHYQSKAPKMIDILEKTVFDYSKELDEMMKESRQYKREMTNFLQDYLREN